MSVTMVTLTKFARESHWLTFIYKGLPRLLLAYICTAVTLRNVECYTSRSHDLRLLSPRTELGNKAFIHSAPSPWNLLQEMLRLTEFVSFSSFTSKLNVLESYSKTGSCFFSFLFIAFHFLLTV